MNAIGDFQFINVLNTKSKSDLFLVKSTTTEKVFVWRTITLKNLSRDKKDNLCKRIRKRIQQDHVLLVQFYPAIEEDKLKLVYVPMDYYPQGNFSDFIKVLRKSGTSHISEEIIVKILFQLSLLVKSVELNDYMKLENIYFDEHFNVKFMNFSPTRTQNKHDVKMCDVGIILMQLCTLTSDKLCEKYTVNKEYYSDQFIDLIEAMLKDNKPINSNIDKIIGHPVILLNTFKLNCGIKLNSCLDILEYRKKLEQLRKKESALKLREHKIEQKEQELKTKEKKLRLHETTLKDKFIPIDSNLKRGRENNLVPHHKYENIDTSLTAEYEEIEEYDEIETSKKLDVSKIKLQPIGRTLSERKIKFKGHSPLKKVNFTRTKSHKKYKEKEKLTINSTESDCTEKKKSNIKLLKDTLDVEKTLIDNKYEEKKKSVSSEGAITTIPDKNMHDMECRPITWTDENKKQAFELLRIMNSTSDKNVWNGEVIHTFL